MATTIATVITDQLSLSPDVVEELSLRRGSKIMVTIERDLKQELPEADRRSR